MGHTLNGNSGIVEIDLYTIAANIYIERGAHIAEGLILYGPFPHPLWPKRTNLHVQTCWAHTCYIYTRN